MIEITSSSKKEIKVSLNSSTSITVTEGSAGTVSTTSGLDHNVQLSGKNFVILGTSTKINLGR